jgi:hypothetical protein
MAAKFQVTFDLNRSNEADYEKVYEWAHRQGGFRYFQFDDGRWGRLASTTVIVPMNAADNASARDQFQKLLIDSGLNPSHVTVVDGNGWATISECIPPHQVPAYARHHVPAGV